jgi:hypothetical protein
MTLKSFFKRIGMRMYYRFKIFVKRGIWEDEPTNGSSIQTNAMNICRRTMHLQDSELLYAPMSQKRYIRNEKLGIFIIIKDKQVDIVNHVYHYNVELSNKNIERVIGMFDRETELRRTTYEKEMLSQIGHSLETILEHVKGTKLVSE